MINIFVSWLIVLVLVLLGVMFFVKPLWIARFSFSWIEIWNRIFFKKEKLPIYTEKQRQDMLNQKGLKYKIAYGLGKFIGVWCWIIALIIIWIELNQ